MKSVQDRQLLGIFLRLRFAGKSANLSGMRIGYSIASVCIAGTIAATNAEAGKYDDLAAWAKKSNANTQQFVDELNKCKTPKQIAAAIRANTERQIKGTDELVRLIAVHPELRDLPDLGLNTESFRTWLDMRPDGEARRDQVPDEPVEISQQLLANNASIKASPQSQNAMRILANNSKDPDVAAAANELREAQRNNQQRLLSKFL
jgi:hypothetical protein